jgi:acyl carrier protein
MQATEQDRPTRCRWEVEHVQRRVAELVGEKLGAEIGPDVLDARLGIEITFDSLDVVEFVMSLEREFAIRIDDAATRGWFTGPMVTIGRLAEMVLALSETQARPRPAWEVEGEPASPVLVPFTQMGPWIGRDEWLKGPLHEPLPPNAEGLSQYRRRTDGMRCTLLPAAEVVVGSAEADAFADQRPTHTVDLSPFLIDAEPVSNAAFARFLNAVGPVPPAVLHEWGLFDPRDRRAGALPWRRGWFVGWQPRFGVARQPAVLVSWYGANAYSLWANRRDWRHYRDGNSVPDELRRHQVEADPPDAASLHSFLPSEAQWEYAARGPEPRRYPWGDAPPTPERLRVARHVPGTAYAVDDLPAADVSARLGLSPFGLHHMAGNVWQWCRDWYAGDFYHRPEASARDAQNEQPTGVRSERGGSWVGPAELARSSYRRGRPPGASGRCLGFRCVGAVPVSSPRIGGSTHG